ncbi:MAG: NAD+ synthase [Deltaproteobacteria bacterium]|nr:NAD+ synthase [Deltaproteobacteria bacterium]
MLRVAMAQINTTVGDLAGNAQKIIRHADKAKASGADVVLFPEMCVTGYPPEDLLLKPGFITDNMRCLEALSKKIKDVVAIIGFVDGTNAIYNAAAVVHNGKILDKYHKIFLPNYGVFDEKRYFRPGKTALNVRLGGVSIGVQICEDIWRPEGPVRMQARAGASLIANINASPFHSGKTLMREEMLSERSSDNSVAIAYNNAVGGQDELVFDGNGLMLDPKGLVVARGGSFEEDLILHDFDLPVSTRKRAAKGLREIIVKGFKPKSKRPPLPARSVMHLYYPTDILEALILGTRDYVVKNGFKRVCAGLSGGIDSSVAASVAVAALGAESVTGVFMPSRYTSKKSFEDATTLAKNLGIKIMTVPINGLYDEYRAALRPAFKGFGVDTTEENLQARIRGNVLMALSNKFGWLVLTTGNKSELSVGYATLYGDMAGGFAVIKDVPKTVVYDVAADINKFFKTPPIPRRVFTKAPTAELKPGQTDQDTLPPYVLLDKILKAYVEQDLSLEEITAMGFGKSLVKKVIRMVDSSEYKRRQAPPGIKITPRGLGKDRRMPITNRYGGK